MLGGRGGSQDSINLVCHCSETEQYRLSLSKKYLGKCDFLYVSQTISLTGRAPVTMYISPE